MRLRPWLTLSSLGVGTYLGEESDAEDQRVIAGVVRAVSRGCNVIDSARNYRCLLTPSPLPSPPPPPEHTHTRADTPSMTSSSTGHQKWY